MGLTQSKRTMARAHMVVPYILTSFCFGTCTIPLSKGMETLVHALQQGHHCNYALREAGDNNHNYYLRTSLHNNASADNTHRGTGVV